MQEGNKMKKKTEIKLSENQKNFLMSKMLWFNFIAFVCFILQGFFGFIVTPEIQATILFGINMWLRIITKEELVWN